MHRRIVRLMQPGGEGTNIRVTIVDIKEENWVHWSEWEIMMKGEEDIAPGWPGLAKSRAWEVVDHVNSY